MTAHTGRVIFDSSAVARPWGIWCEGCKKIIGACQSQQDAEDVLENHKAWQEVKAKWEAATK